MSQFEPVARGLYLEGLAFDAQRGVVWYSDVIAGGVHGLHPDGRVQTLNPERMWTGGIMMNHDGCVLSSGQGGIMWNDPQGGESGWLLSEIDGQPVNGINEMSPDGAGGIYFGTIDLDAVVRGATPGPSAIYRLTADRQVVRAAEGLTFTNGLMLGADGRRFFCNDTFVSAYAFDVAADGTLTNRRLLAEKADVDGMALDGEGNVWITGFRSSEITRIRADGSQLAPFPTPAGAITQVRFGGADLRDLYITAVPADGGDSLAVGELPTEPRSILYRGRSDTPGAAIPPARFSLR